MGKSDIGNHTDIRPCDFCKPCHFSEITDPHFKDSHLVFFPDVEYRQRKTDFVVKVAFCFQHPVFLGENRSNHFFCACLSYTAGDAYNFDIQASAVVLCNVFERLQTGRNLNPGEGNISQILF